MDKKQIATINRIKRSNLDKDLKKKYDQAIHCEVYHQVENLTHIALFASFGQEIETYTLIESLLEKEYHVYLPKVEGKIINFYEIYNLKNLKKSSFGILEPKATIPVDKKNLDAIIVPLLAFNKDKYRVGYGGGYYDSYLKDYSGLKLGIAYSFQYTEEDFVEKFDIACDYIATERGLK